MLRTILLAVASSLLMAVLGSTLLVTHARAAGLAQGAGSFQFVDHRGNADRPLTVWYFAPAKLQPNSPVVFVMHGMGRNASQYRDQWIKHAEQQNFLLIAPEFSEAAYPGDAYSLGNMFDSQGQAVDSSKWAYSAIEHLFDHVKELTGNTSAKYWIYGHSAGGQFVHRLVLFLPEARYQRAVAANPGWYTMPDTRVDFPYGVKQTAVSNATLAKSFAHPFTLLLGDQDTKRDDPNLRKTPAADAQGPHRFARGKKYFETAQRKASNLKVPFRWKQQVVPGAGHSDRQMSDAAARALFAR